MNENVDVVKKDTRRSVLVIIMGKIPLPRLQQFLNLDDYYSLLKM